MISTEQTGVPAGSMMLDVDGVQLAVCREGDGQAVICLHAIGHGGGDFAGFTTAFRSQFEIVRIDWPGQGRSGPDTHPASAARYAQLLGGVVDQLGITAPILVGNSIGGAAAILHARQRPVRALVLCDTGGLVRVSAIVRATCACFVAFFSAGERKARWFGWAFALYYRYLVLPRPAAVEQRERIIHSGPVIARILREAWQSFGKPDADLRAQAEALDLPIWLAWAKSDRVIPLLMCMPSIRRMKRARVTKFRGGHSAFLEDPEAFNAGFREFVDAINSPGAAL
ncbi:MAG: alpha/beta hydrolase [Pseudomonadota bacterium]|nr:alpha/beta hydrolase [Pseudomonadota bacterium]